MFIVYRVLKVEFFVLKAGYYLVEWVGARQMGRVVTKVRVR